jgi:hypothetical protein
VRVIELENDIVNRPVVQSRVVLPEFAGRAVELVDPCKDAELAAHR